MMSRCAVFVLLLTLGIGIQLSHAVEVSVNNTDNKLCLYANLMVNFSVAYEVAGNKNETAEFELPEKVTTEGSSCDNTSSTLKLNFGKGHSWTVAFSMKEKTYQADSITFSYNLSDSTIFPNATSNGTKTVTVEPSITNVGVDTCFSCKSKEMFHSDGVSQTLWNVLIQAFVSNGSKSENITSCAADIPATTVAPTTNATTAVPITNSTTPMPPTTPPPAPATGNYTIKQDGNGTACLLANLGLQISYNNGGKINVMNLDPFGTKATGSCGVNSSELMLNSSTLIVVFTFTNDSKKFHLHGLNITAKASSGLSFTEGNTNLSLWEAAVGSSYLCNKEQNYNITNLLAIHTFDLHVQPFAVQKDMFSTAHECSMDDTSILIPIIVGAALAGLILIVVIAYVIGRRKTYVGYQTL